MSFVLCWCCFVCLFVLVLFCLFWCCFVVCFLVLFLVLFVFCCLFQVGDPVDVIACESKVACTFSVFFSVNRVFEKEFEGLKLLACRSHLRHDLLYLLNLAEPNNVKILRGRHPANPRSHANCAVNRVFEKYFEGFKLREYHSHLRHDLLYLLNLSDLKKVHSE